MKKQQTVRERFYCSLCGFKGYATSIMSSRHGNKSCAGFLVPLELKEPKKPRASGGLTQ